jgi:hypothetical protein
MTCVCIVVQSNMQDHFNRTLIEYTPTTVWPYVFNVLCLIE